MHTGGRTLHERSEFVNLEAHTAEDIADALLQRTGLAFLTGDADAFVTCFSLPQVFETERGKIDVTNRGQLVRMFEAARGYYNSHGVTDIDRAIVHAEFKSDDTICSTHESRLLMGTSLVQEPYPVFSIIRRFETRWLISSRVYGATNDSVAGRALNAAFVRA